MPSARQIEIDETVRIQTDAARTDFHSLLHTIRATNISKLNSLHGRGKVLFAEGELARGVYVLRTGRAAVSISSSDGRVAILRLARAGDVLGLNSVLRHSYYDTTVKAVEPCCTDFISRHELLALMDQSKPVMHAILEILSREFTETTERARSLLLSQTTSARLAKLILEWCEESRVDKAGVPRIDRAFTQEEIAQMICSSRETVTRLLTSLSSRRIIRVTQDSILVLDRAALETMTCAKRI